MSRQEEIRKEIEESIKEKEKKESRSFTLSNKIITKLEKEAIRLKTNRSFLLQTILEEFFK